MDIEFLTEHFYLFKSEGAAYADLEIAGIILYGFSDDVYYIKGAGSFNMFYNGITVEMLGSHEPLSKKFLPDHLNHKPTRIQLAKDLWIPVPAYPGLYTRGRYGLGYLFQTRNSL